MCTLQRRWRRQLSLRLTLSADCWCWQLQRRRRRRRRRRRVWVFLCYRTDWLDGIVRFSVLYSTPSMRGAGCHHRRRLRVLLSGMSMEGGWRATTVATGEQPWNERRWPEKEEPGEGQEGERPQRVRPAALTAASSLTDSLIDVQPLTYHGDSMTFVLLHEKGDDCSTMYVRTYAR